MANRLTLFLNVFSFVRTTIEGSFFFFFFLLPRFSPSAPIRLTRFGPVINSAETADTVYS